MWSDRVAQETENKKDWMREGTDLEEKISDLEVVIGEAGMRVRVERGVGALVDEETLGSRGDAVKVALRCLKVVVIDVTCTQENKGHLG